MANTKSFRRYKVGDNKTYDVVYDRERSRSVILSPLSGHRNMLFNGLVPIDTINQANRLLEIFEGEKGANGNITLKNNYDVPEPCRARIPKIKDDLKEVEKEFKQYKQKEVNKGFEEPTEMPEHLLTKKRKLEALYDVYIAELDYVKQIKRELEREDDNEHKKNVLKHGLRQSCKYRGGILKEIDKQNVSVTNGTLVIDDKYSPYNGMKVVDYRKLAKEWAAERTKANQEADKKRAEEARKYGRMSTKRPYSPLTAVRREQLPAFPEWAVNVKEQSDVKRTRKRKTI